ncbi:chalcone isomerase family protein [Ottowia sp.]|uniref:chalcone isomerase family protein n=1 Tax=Ottowia sp. TaxID=1898956 RepID=UPI002638641F|nr:chalcone isomerase family protein [Ottowia sp.]
MPYLALPNAVSRRVALRLSGAVLLLGCALCALPGVARAAEVAGVQFPDKVTVAGHPLVLNGAGVRYKAVFKVYVAGLYVPVKSSSVNDLISTDKPRRFTFTMLRDIESDEFGKMFSRGIEDNMTNRAEFSKLVPGILRMSQLFSERKVLRAGDECQLDWIPGTGTVLTIQGQKAGAPFPEPAFFQALMRIWLGNKPADWQLKDALLGKSGN